MSAFDETDYEHQVEEENYFVSMTDMMVGLVFIFIILMMYFVVQLSRTTEQLTNTDTTRKAILADIQQRLRQSGFQVDMDAEHGILRLPDQVLFDKGKADVTPQGQSALQKIGDVLLQVLPCYADGLARPPGCPPAAHRIESLYIEGHTDKDAMAGGGLIHDNWDLSVSRATNTYRALIGMRPTLTRLCLAREGDCRPILSVAGYGPDRPVAKGDDDASKARNRRIDLRLLMETPRAQDVQKVLDGR
jgi:chemotaxis protein MotB